MGKTQPKYPEINISGKVVESFDINAPKVRKIVWNAPRLIQWFLQEKAKLGDNISAKFTVKRPKRSEEQNNFFHLYLSLISISSGHTIRELKGWYKGKFLSQGISEVFGDKVRVVKSSAELNISEFCELVNLIEEFTGIPTPDPKMFNVPLTHDEYGKLKVKQKEDYQTMKIKKISPV